MELLTPVLCLITLSLLPSSQGRSLGHHTPIGPHVPPYIPSTAHITRDHPFTIEPATPMVHFTKQGHVVQATGTAHLVFHFDLGSSLQTADQLIASATSALDAAAEPHLIQWKSKYNRPPEGYPPLMPPGPLDALIPRRHITAKTGDSAMEAWYYARPTDQQTLTEAFTRWLPTESTSQLTFGQFLDRHYPDAVHDIYMHTFNWRGPYPHVRAPTWQSTVQERQNYTTWHFIQTLGPATLIHRLGKVRLDIASLLDLGRPAGTSGFDIRDLYAPKLNLDAFPEAFQPQSTPDGRTKRNAVRGLVSTLWNWTRDAVSGIFGLFTTDDLKEVVRQADKLAMKRDKILARKVDSQAQALQTLYNTSRLIDEQVHEDVKAITSLHNYQFLNGLASVLELSIQDLKSIINGLAAGRPSAALAASFDIKREMAALSRLAAARGQQILLASNADLMQCDASFLIQGAKLQIIVHIPMAHNAEILELYTFNPFPFPIGSHGDKTLYAQVYHDENLLAVNKNRNIFRSVAPHDLSHCLQSGVTHICSQGSITKTFDHDSTALLNGIDALKEKAIDNCLFALLIGLHDAAQHACSVTLTPPHTAIHQLSPNRFAVVSRHHQSQGYVFCHNKVWTFTVLPYSQITMDPSCSAQVNNFRMVAGDTLTVNKSTAVPLQPQWIMDISNTVSRQHLEALDIMSNVSSSPLPPLLPDALQAIEEFHEANSPTINLSSGNNDLLTVLSLGFALISLSLSLLIIIGGFLYLKRHFPETLRASPLGRAALSGVRFANRLSGSYAQVAGHPPPPPSAPNPPPHSTIKIPQAPRNPLPPLPVYPDVPAPPADSYGNAPEAAANSPKNNYS